MTDDPEARAEGRTTPDSSRPVLVGAAVAVAYLVSGLLGPWIHADPERVVTPAAGVALAALLLFGARFGVVVWGAAAVVGVASGLSPMAAILTGGACALGAVAGSLLLRGADGFRFRMDRVRDVAAFAVLGVLAGPAVAAFIGGPVLVWTGDVGRDTMAAAIVGWWISDAAGVLLVTPLILALVADHRRVGWSRAWPLEAVAGLVVTALLAVTLFGGRLPPDLAEAVLLAPLPLLIWGVFRFGLHGAASVMAVVAGVVVWRSSEGYGPFAEAAGAGTNTPLWIYLVTLGLVALLTWALVANQRSALERFQVVFEDSSDGILLLRQGRVTHCNPAAVQLFGTRSTERLLGLDIAELSPPEQPDGTSSAAAMRRHVDAADRTGGHRFEWLHERREGTTFPAEISLSPVVVGGEAGHLALVRDVSDRRARQETVERARAEAEAADRAKTAYLARVSHRIRTALHTNLGFARMTVGDESLPARHREHLRKIVASGETVLGLVDEVLETSRIESDRKGWRKTEGREEADPPPRRVAGLAGGQEPPRILIVDDTEENRTLLEGLLGGLGFETRTATDGAEAIDAFGAWRPDLVLMDREMPVMDGVEATRRIKASERGAGTPVVMVTAGGFGESPEDIVAAGADGYVRVPFHEAEILREIGRHLDVRYRYAD